MIEAAVDVGGELAQFRFKPLRISVLVTVSDCDFERNQRFKQRAAELLKHVQALGPAGA